METEIYNIAQVRKRRAQLIAEDWLRRLEKQKSEPIPDLPSGSGDNRFHPAKTPGRVIRKVILDEDLP